MGWDDRFILEHEKWFHGPAGEYSLEQEVRLLRHMVAGWPRRGQRLLEVGCGPGYFLEALWDTGFNVTGVDPSPNLLKSARARMGKRADLHVGRQEYLPFDDNEYDFVVVMRGMEICDDPQRVVAEAVRVARKGVVIGYLNSLSVHYWVYGKVWPWTDRSDIRHSTHWMNWLQVRRMLAIEAGCKPSRSRSVLIGPVCSWRYKWFCRMFNHWLLPPWLGVYGAVRYDLVDQKPLTPVGDLRAQYNPVG